MINVVIILVVLAAAAGALTLAFRVKKGVEPGPVRSLATIGFFVVGVLLVGAGLSGVIRAAVPSGDLFRDENLQLARALSYLAVGLPLSAGLWRQVSPWLKSGTPGPGWLLGWPFVSIWALVAATIGLGQTLAWLVGGDASPDGVGRLIGWSVVLVAAARVEQTHRVWIGKPDSAALWALILPAFSAVALIPTVLGIGATLAWLAGGDSNPEALGVGIAWGSVWFGTRWAERRLPPGHDVTPILWGLVTLIAMSVTSILFLTGLFEAALDSLTGSPVIGDRDFADLLPQAAWAVWGLAMWSWLWLADATRRKESVLREAYALLVGVSAPVVALIASLASSLFLVAEWYIGTPETSSSRIQFDMLPPLLAVAVVSAGVLIHHRRIAHVPSPADRRARYIVAGAGLAAAASGLGSIITAILLSLSGDVVAGDSGVDVLLGGAIAMAVGGITWWSQWSVMARRVTGNAEERSFPSRKLYLGLVLTVFAVAALISLVTVVFGMFRAVLGDSRLLTEGFSVSVGVLVASALLGGIHWNIWRADRALAPAKVAVAPVVAREIMLVTGGPVAEAQLALSRPDRRLWVWHDSGQESGRPLDEIEAAIAGSSGSRVLVIERPAGVEVIELDR
jgi:hypothetical protein